MSKLFNSSINNATANQAQVEDQKGNKLSWLKTGAIVIGGTAAAVGAAIGAKKLYEKFSDLDGKLDAADLPEDLEDRDGSGMESEEPTENETNDSSNQETSFKEVEPESNSDDSIFVSAEELADTKDTTSSVPKPELDENGNFILPEGKSWNDLVRSDIMNTFKDLEKYFMNVSDTDMGDPIWVIRSSVSIFNKAASFANKTAWEDAYIESMREDLDAYLMYYMRGLETRFADTHRMGDLIYVRRLYDEYLSSPFYTYPLGKEMRDILENIENELQKYKALKHSPAPEKDELDKELESSEDSKENSGVVTASAKEDVAETETAATLAETATPVSEVTPEASDSAVSETDNNEAAIDQFSEDMDFLKKLMTAGNYKGAQTFFRDTFSSYLVDENVSDDLKNELDGIRTIITDTITNKVTPRSSQKKKGGKRGYKKNGRR